jgi:hypothetical protein
MTAKISPKIVIVDESPIRAAILEEGLQEAGFSGVVHISETQRLLTRICALDPAVIVIDLENPSHDVLEQMFQVSRAVGRPRSLDEAEGLTKKRPTYCRGRRRCARNRRSARSRNRSCPRQSPK